MPLSNGFYFALTKAELKSLRSLRGDPKRRRHVELLKSTHASEWVAAVGSSWSFLAHLFDPESNDHVPALHYFFQGRSLHRGQFYRIELLDQQTLAPLADVLGTIDQAKANGMFFAIDDEQFYYRHVSFWVLDEWKQQGRTTAKTKEQYEEFWPALQLVREFLQAASQADRSVVFCCNFHRRAY